jgi:hypothetical protein
MIVNDMDPRVPGASNMQSQINDYSAGMLSKNLLNLSDLVKTKDLNKYLDLGPMMNLSDGDNAIAAPDDDDSGQLDSSKNASLSWGFAIGGVILSTVYWYFS